MKIVVLDGNALNPGDLSWNELQETGDVTIYERTPRELVRERIADADAVFTNKTVIKAEHLEGADRLKYIGVLATGYEQVDLQAAKEHGIIVTNVPNYGTEAVAQYAIALLLELCHHIGDHSAEVKKGSWERSKEWCFWNKPMIELLGKTMGIIGYGRIGRQVSKIAQAIGMKVMAVNSKVTENYEEDGVLRCNLDHLLKHSDVISLHCPLFPETRDMINKDSIAKMKDGVLLINNARGRLIVDQDLAEALNSGKIKAAALDVVSREPIREDNPLLSCSNVILTPHISWAAKDTRNRLLSIAVENFKAFLKGSPVHVVNQ